MLTQSARETARSLIAREQAGAGSPFDDVAAAERALRRLMGELVGWFGPFGTHALMTRALAHAHAAHPVLAGVTVGMPAAPDVVGLTDRAREHDAATAGAVDLMAWVVELLGRLIGDNLATLLIGQSVRHGALDPPAHAPPVPPTVSGAPDRDMVGDGTDTPGDTNGGTTDD